MPGFRLLQNYPNPFNPSTRIRFEIPSSSRVRLTVLDALGRERALLADGDKARGVYEVDFVPKDLESGVYFCRIDIRETGTGKIEFRTIKLIISK